MHTVELIGSFIRDIGVLFFVSVFDNRKSVASGEIQRFLNNNLRSNRSPHFSIIYTLLYRYNLVIKHIFLALIQK